MEFIEMTPVNGFMVIKDVEVVAKENEVYVCAEPLHVMNTSIPDVEELRIVSINKTYWRALRWDQFYFDCCEKCQCCCLCTCSCITILFILFGFIYLILAGIMGIQKNK